MSKPNKIQISQEFKERLENIYGNEIKESVMVVVINAQDEVGI